MIEVGVANQHIVNWGKVAQPNPWTPLPLEHKQPTRKIRIDGQVVPGNLNQETAVADECDSKFSFTRQLGLIGAARSWSHR